MTQTLQLEEALFSSALALPESERARFLDRACGDDRSLRERIDALLSGVQPADDFISPIIPSAAADSKRSWLEEHAEVEAIGPYRLLHQIGEGGCGVVYLAEQSQPLQRQVALKIIKLGMDTRAVVSRFQAERQVLAMMDHPGIATVFDAGSTPTGRPYFVMELVRGIKITDYCAQCRLTLEERIRLFIQVCHAIQHAHAKGVIHRDIKPSNILVTLHEGAALAKVIDFGVAKATQGRVGDHTQFTAFDQFVGTPAYMSPEQTYPGNGAVDAQSDIYALGVLLYELLTGCLPFDVNAVSDSQIAAIKQRIRGDEPQRPSHKLRTLSPEQAAVAIARVRVPLAQLSKHLQGELDWIVLRCLEKEPGRRYASATELAQDLERHLRNEPVLARPHTAVYALAKFARRHRAVVGMFAVFVLFLVGATAVSAWLAVRARQAEHRAQIEAASREQVINFLRDDLLAQAGPDEQPEPDVKLRTVLDRAAAKARERFVDQPLIEANVQYTLATTYDALGAYATAREHHERALELRRQQLGEDHPETLQSRAQLVSIMIAESSYEEAEPLAMETLDRMTRVRGAEHSDTLAHAGNVALLLYQRGKFEQMVSLLEKILPTQQRILGEAHEETLSTMNNLAIGYRNQGRYLNAQQLHAQELAICRKAFGPEHPSTLTSMNNLANTHADLGQWDQAMALNGEAFEISRRIAGEDHPETLIIRHNLATSHREIGDLQTAERLQTQTVELSRRTIGVDHTNTLRAENLLASIYRDRGELGAAAKLQASVVERATKAYGADHPLAIVTATHLAQTYQEQGNLARAETLLREVAPRAIEVFGPTESYTLDLNDRLASVLIERGNFSDALELLRETSAQRERNAPTHWRTLKTQSLLGVALAGAGLREESEKVLKSTYERLMVTRLPAYEARLRQRTAQALVALYATWNKPAEAARWRETVTTM
ncbi:serine/threonine protein kinase [Steroidobacter sp. S1-65]|uniref:Serine/threonine protein kinase n=1 Tax=Steroidobacter gossypii TaxID=2805490 RepID=A0ABS1X0W0_9GAMM|nr:serine/threonine-protein kinase [Steroidobacter gossypii]MBM0106880.1 serine/threonine protein kinase [Steroidobacter gossypii]